MKTGIPTCLAFLVLTVHASPVLPQGVPSSGERAALVRVVSYYNGNCNESNRPAWNNMVNNWYDDITDDRTTPYGHGNRAWWRDGFYHNGRIVDSDFVDPDLRSWGNDDGDDRVDAVDACLIGLHGGIRSDRWVGAVRVDEAGDGNCFAWQGHMQFGDEDLEFLHLSACHSLDQPEWTDWADSFSRLHQITGFHGVMYVQRGYGHRYGSFSDDAFDMSIADSWLDNLYKYRYRNHSMCPVAMAMGEDGDDAWERIDNERYNHVYPDPNRSTYGAVIYVAGCNPNGEAALPE